MPDYDDLVSGLMTLLESRGTQFVVVGGIALLQYVPGRNTDDIDLLISAVELKELPELVIQERSELFAYCKFGGLRVDVLLTEHRLFNLVRERFSAPMSYRTGQYATATVEGLLLLKLFALPSLYRQFDFDRVAIYEADIMQLVRRTSQSDDFFLEILSAHISESDQTELRGVLTDTRNKLKRTW